MVLGVYVFFLQHVFTKNPVKFNVYLMFIICKYFVFISENSFFTNVLYYIVSHVK